MPRPALRPDPRPRRRLATALVLLTALAGALDLAGAPGPGAVRAVGGTVLGPLERLLSHGASAPPSAAGEALEAATDAELDRAQGVRAAAYARLVAAPETRGRQFVAARVVAVGRVGAAGPERVTIDAGSRDGVRADTAVVSADGLVGRVVSVSPWTADVLLLGAADLTVAVRVAPSGVLGSVGSGAQGSRRRPAGQLDLSAVQRGRLTRGDTVTTLGGLDGGPFPPGLRVGTVADVDTDPAQLVPGASVTPAADLAALDVVGVLVGTARTTPRAPATGTATGVAGAGAGAGTAG
ncbi:rod shape-determining protein MreC [Pedococcus sp. 2YAF34]|uniref:rod shape-determining protein MreC n=1 Tax=Pedococcus sp. 2YAF34 TaxID=3233032 RepID=UPI003F9DFFB1